MDKITLPTVPLFRTLNNQWLADVLYYFTHYHGRLITEICVHKMNQEYLKYLAEHPTLKSLRCLMFGHSLGGIICYDIACNQSQSGYPMLDFRPTDIFSAGSPIAAVMVMRAQQYENYRPPDDIRLHNIFHPYDPMAYRMEPLLDDSLAELEPVLLDHWNGEQFHLQQKYRQTLQSISHRLTVGLPEFWSLPAVLLSSSTALLGSYTTSTVAAVESVPQTSNLSVSDSSDPPRKRRRVYKDKGDPMQSSPPPTPPDAEAPTADAVTFEQPSMRPAQVLCGKSARPQSISGGGSLDWLRIAINRLIGGSSSSSSSNSGDSKPSVSQVKAGSDCSVIPVPGTCGAADKEDNDGAALKRKRQDDLLGEHSKLLPHRLDYALRINMLESIRGEYLTGLPAHFSYWDHKDIINYMLTLVEPR